MSGTNNRTLDIDKLFVREIIYKDKSNRPIAPNQVLVSRGDGGTYFGNIPSTSGGIGRAYNTFRGGSNIVFEASNATNTLWLSNGAGIGFYSTVIACGDQPVLHIYATGPEQITIGNQTLNFSSLTDSLTGGRTLYYAAEGDTTLRISDTTIIYGSQYNSSLSTVYALESTAAGLINALSSIIQSTSFVTTSTQVGYVWSSLTRVETTAYDLSSFIYSTFVLDGNGDRTILQINSISTNSITVGSNAINDYSIQGNDNPDQCVVIINNTPVSTITNYLYIQDAYTHVKASIEKEYIIAQSTIDTSTFKTEAQQVQYGWFPSLSTQGASNLVREAFIPILQQIQILEQTIDINTSSYITNYALLNVAKLDKICNSNAIEIDAPNVIISSLVVSSINGLPPGSGGGTLSTFDSMYANNGYFSTIHVSSIASDAPIYITSPAVYISNLNVSSINGQEAISIVNNYYGGASTIISTFSTIYWSTAYALNTNTTYADISTMMISTIMGDDLPILTFDRQRRRVGVNLGDTQQPRSALDVNGIVYANNFVTTSDRRMKKNITALPTPACIPSTYRFQYAETDTWDIGCMADEVERVAPECVYTTDTGYKAVDYSKLVPLCLTLIHDLHARVSKMEVRDG